MTAPSGGWQIVVDRIDEQYKARELFVTVRRPAPGFEYAQATVEQRVATAAPVQLGTTLYARVLAGDARDSEPYRLVSSRAP